MSTVANCEICSMPSWAIASNGVSFRLRQSAKNACQRESKRTVWCCSESCTRQVFAISKMGAASHKWPISFAEFCAAHAAEITKAQAGSDCYETYAETRINRGSKEGLFQFMGPEYQEGVSSRSEAPKVSIPRKGGRPRKWSSNAAKMRAHRAQKRELQESSV